MLEIHENFNSAATFSRMKTTRPSNMLSPKSAQVLPNPFERTSRGTLTSKKSSKLVMPSELIYNRSDDRTNQAYRKKVKKLLKEDEK